MSNADSEADKCAVATNAAMEVAMDECSPQGLLSNIGRMVGLEWVSVRARELIDDGEPLPDAIEQAWDEAGDDCGW